MDYDINENYKHNDIITTIYGGKEYKTTNIENIDSNIQKKFEFIDTNLQNIYDLLHVKYSGDELQQIEINENEKLKKLKQQYNEKLPFLSNAQREKVKSLQKLYEGLKQKFTSTEGPQVKFDTARKEFEQKQSEYNKFIESLKDVSQNNLKDKKKIIEHKKNIIEKKEKFEKDKKEFDKQTTIFLQEKDKLNKQKMLLNQENQLLQELEKKNKSESENINESESKSENQNRNQSGGSDQNNNKKIHIYNILFFIILFINFYYFYFYSDFNIATKRTFRFNKECESSSITSEDFINFFASKNININEFNKHFKNNNLTVGDVITFFQDTPTLTKLRAIFNNNELNIENLRSFTNNQRLTDTGLNIIFDNAYIADFLKNYSKHCSINNTSKLYSQNISNFILQSFILYNIFLITIIIIITYYRPLYIFKFLQNRDNINRFMKPFYYLYDLIFNILLWNILIYNILLAIIILFINTSLVKTYLSSFKPRYLNMEDFEYNDYINITKQYSNIYYNTLLIVLAFFSFHILSIPNLFVYKENYVFYIPYFIMLLYILFKFFLNYNFIYFIFITILILYILMQLYTKEFSKNDILIILIIASIFLSLIPIDNDKFSKQQFNNAINKETTEYRRTFSNYSIPSIIDLFISYITFNINKFLSFII
jgi:hypothetical protein